MCGIVGYVGPKPVLPVIMEGLRKLEYRGYDSAGVAIVKQGNSKFARSAGKLSNLDNVLAKDPIDGQFGIGHTGGQRTAGRRKRTRIRIATARAASSSCTTASSRTISTSSAN
jgi:glucosamine 6-phosphate synthetase-like amidotransferase/phosphosugar isomerase protein